jgi:hypothetical protein
MSILAELSSQVGDRTEGANRAAAQECLANPALLDQIAVGLAEKDANLVGDCAEVMTMVAEQQPALVAPYADRIVPVLSHKKTRPRWEVAHATALIAALVPETIQTLLPQFERMLGSDQSVIVRDYLVEALGNYATTGESAARAAHPLLRAMLVAWEGKQTGKALLALAKVAAAVPDLRNELRTLGESYLNHGRNVVRKAAAVLVKAAENRFTLIP